MSKKIIKEKIKLICIIIIIFFAVSSFAFSAFIFKKRERASEAKIYIKDHLISEVDNEKIDINKDLIFIIYTNDNKEIFTNVIYDLNNELPQYQNYDYNIIEIKNKKIRCVGANCPDKICVHHDILRDDIDNDMIICAPHKMTICYQ